MDQELNSERRKLLRSVEKLLDGPMTFLGFLWLILLVIELVWGLTPVLEFLTLIIWLVFIVDFVLKFVLAPSKIQFLRKNALTAISLFIPALRVFRIFRFIRLLKGLRGIRLFRIITSLNRGIKSLSATMNRRAFGYVTLLSVVVTFAGAAGMYALENPNPGFTSYGLALWWTAMRIVTAGSDFWPLTPEGRTLAFLLSLFGYSVFGYITATLASFFIGRDAEEKDAPLAGAAAIGELTDRIECLTRTIHELQAKIEKRSA